MTFNVLPVGEFRELLEAAARQFPTKEKFAKALGITPGRLSRILGGEHSLDVLNCLKLAKLTGDSPSRILRVAGKSQVADLIESLYGQSSPWTPAERELVDLWNALTQRQRQTLQLLMADLQPESRKGAKTDGAARRFSGHHARKRGASQ